ncbi:hypothetical protein PR003_g21559 [Phytophthora rubi]|uniref:Uncharacterized protein n=1 Tax=Phytophthora rubi TaxID=129364 RepID=A0A6A3IYQ3_9STRA|nr:hypothetical protein PR001_g22887 [Phytophthora rubi]KAE8986509.1 hypothetical protein PR002_g22333 [Phytophthora rubi]KAE9305211.1 hypothetical protein PR003_g21559 [Phytophthora rubi]
MSNRTFWQVNAEVSCCLIVCAPVCRTSVTCKLQAFCRRSIADDQQVAAAKSIIELQADSRTPAFTTVRCGLRGNSNPGFVQIHTGYDINDTSVATPRLLEASNGFKGLDGWAPRGEKLSCSVAGVIFVFAFFCGVRQLEAVAG